MRTKEFDDRVDAAKKQYQDAENKYQFNSWFWPVAAAAGATLITAFLTYSVNVSDYVKQETLDAVEERLQMLEDNRVLPEMVKDLSDLVDRLERTAVAPATVSALDERVSQLEGEDLLESLDERLRALEVSIEVLGSGGATPGAGQ